MKHPEKNHWWPNQKMPLEFFFERGNLIYYTGCNSPKKLSYKHAIELANDAEILAKELREAASMIINKEEEFDERKRRTTSRKNV